LRTALGSAGEVECSLLLARMSVAGSETQHFDALLKRVQRESRPNEQVTAT
jgi:hypothetical protein